MCYLHRTPISRPVSRDNNSTARKRIAIHTRLTTFTSCRFANRTLLLALLAANRIAPDTRRDQAVAILCERPGGFCRPRETLVPNHVQRVVSHYQWLSTLRRQSLSGSWLGRFSFLHSVGWHKHGVQSFALGVLQSGVQAHRVWPNRYTKHRLTSKGFCSRSM